MKTTKNKAERNMKNTAKRDRTTGSVLFGILSGVIIAAVLLISIPAAVPRLLGYQVYNIVSESMYPALSVGSAIYVKGVDNPADDIKAGDIAVYERDGFVIAHRVVSNDTQKGEIHTKGDSNDAEDMLPVPYGQILGAVRFHIDHIGALMFWFNSAQSRIYLITLLMGGVMCGVISHMLSKRNHENEAKNENENENEDEQPHSSQQSHIQAKLKLVIAAGVIVLAALIATIVIIAKILMQYGSERKAYEEVAEQVVRAPKISETAAAEESGEKACPIEVDFDSLQKINPDIIGWIYCEDSVINYPVCYSGEDEFYLKHAYDRTEKKSGAIFLEGLNDAGFADHNSILYGHHMKDKSMFATLSLWSEQEYYEKHPCMWLLTPQKNYRIDLIAGYYTSADSSSYTVFEGYSDLLNDYIGDALSDSDFEIDKEAVFGDNEYAKEKYVMLSTCEYTFEDARYVLHGALREQ